MESLEGGGSAGGRAGRQRLGAASVLIAGASEERNGCGSERGEDKDECGRQRLGDGVW